ncbi:MAG: response regulator transcription factor, partial [Burkholderiales bacterium]|nr:response regulator transcription factor [Opitutaceae bacterium]
MTTTQPRSESAVASTAKTPRAGGRVLLIEDRPELAEVYAGELRAAGHAVES